MSEGKEKQPAKEVIVLSKAFVAMALHCIKHRNETVHGILVGTSKEKEGLITVQDAIPISHGAPTMPIVETAIGLVDAQEDNSTLSIVGWYTAPMLLEDTRPGPVALRMAANIAVDSSLKVDPILLVVQNKALGECAKNGNPAKDAVKAYGRDFGNQWLDPIKTTVENEGEKAGICVQKAVQQNIVVNDLVDHLDGLATSLWYPNHEISKLVS